MKLPIRAWSLVMTGLLLCPPLLAQGEDIVIMAEDARQHIGEYAQVCGNIVDATYARGSKGEPTYLNFTNPHPRQNFTVVVWGEDRHNFDYPPESLIQHQACVYGKISRYRSQPQMVITIPEQISARPIPAPAPSAATEQVADDAEARQ